jgi:hypothetical protein
MKSIPIHKFLIYLEKNQIPPAPPECASPGGHDFKLDNIDLKYEGRRAATKRNMWAIVDQVWTKQLADWIGNRRCLEVMAGAGWLTKALNNYGINIIATDFICHQYKMVFDIKQMCASTAVKKYADRDILIMSWPPYSSNIDIITAKLWGSNKPIVYIGEGQNGCTGTEKFWQHFEVIEDHPQIDLMAWPGIHDYVFIGHYKK